MIKKVGYPEQWKDYSSYDGGPRARSCGNAMRGNIWRSDYYIAKLHKPVDRTEWDMTPQTYNAYYNPSNNEIVLPAAVFILPGIADSLVDDAIVYGYAGGTHDRPRDHARLRRRGPPVRRAGQPDELVDAGGREGVQAPRRGDRATVQRGTSPSGDLHVNGEATQGENIADLGGMQLGWDAFKKTDAVQARASRSAASRRRSASSSAGRSAG